MSTTCTICHGEMTNPHSVTTTGLLEGEWDCHERCLDEFMVGIDEKRSQFAELIAAGVPRHEANRIMISRIEGEAAS